MSLWSPETNPAWLHIPGPELRFLPEALWLIGLGNLGQAYLWSLAWLPYREPTKVRLTLQDHDTITPQNFGTSILVRPQNYNRLKSRVLADWVEARGFRSTLVERRFDGDIHLGPDEPRIALAGVDNIAARRQLGEAGFNVILDGGLGATAADYQHIRVTGFPRRQTPAELWAAVDDRRPDYIRRLLDKAAYQDIPAKTPKDDCGKALLAGQSVAAPFIGAAAGAVVVAQAVRVATGEPHYEIVDLHMDSLATMRSVRHEARDPQNLGFLDACG
jgi:hypothetical protein